MHCEKCFSYSTVQIVAAKRLNGDYYEEYKCQICNHITSVVNGTIVPSYGLVPLIPALGGTAGSGTKPPVTAIKPNYAVPIPTSMAGWISNTTPVAPTTTTREEYIQLFWDEVKRMVDGWEELSQLATYWYLNKTGVTMTGIDQRLESLLKAKFPKEKK
jgi:hypothetical protein